MIKNIVFDIGGVLVEFEPEKLMKRAGMPEEKLEDWMKASVRSKWWPEMDRGFFEEEELLRFMQEDSPEFSKELAWFMETGKREVVEPFDYSEGWLKSLKERGYHNYLLTNYPDSFFELHSRERFTFMPYVDGQIVSAVVELIKPDPNIYRVLLKTYGLKAEECVFIDDRRENVETAKKLGFHGICFESFEQATAQLEELL